MRLPDELRELTERDQWVVWMYVPDPDRPDKKPRKPPVDPKTGDFAKANDPSTWSTFTVATSAYERSQGRYQGVGYEFTADDPYVGVDLDHVIVDGKILPEAQAIVDLLDTYAEISPSGTGVHLLIRAHLINGMKNKVRLGEASDIEIYQEGRYFTTTGNVLVHKPIGDRQDQLVEMYLRYFFTQAKASPTVATSQPAVGGSGEKAKVTESRSELWRKMFASKNGAEIRRLYDGDLSDYTNAKGEPDHSRADQALCNYLAYWCNYDKYLIDEMYRESKLYRPKWDKRHEGVDKGGRTYGEITIDKACQGKAPYREYTPEEKRAYAKKKQAERDARVESGYLSRRSGKSDNTSKYDKARNYFKK